jgi:F420-dependent oxidoreductase-like protein
VRLGFSLGYPPPGASPLEAIELAQEAEHLGFDSAWAAEAWGTDCVSVLAWLGATTTAIKLGSAIMQIPARTPASTAMTAATLDLLSGGRFVLGLGTSGPQVVEGWHGEAWGKPLLKTREYVEIVRAVLRREVLEHHGEHYDIPLRDGSGLGKPLKLMARPLRADVPIYLAAISPKAVTQAFEIADGWLPIFWSPEQTRNVFRDAFATIRPDFDVAAFAPLVLTDDVEAGRNSLKPYYALYVGGMGSRGKNFYNDLAARYGYEAE